MTPRKSRAVFHAEFWTQDFKAAVFELLDNKKKNYLKASVFKSFEVRRRSETLILCEGSHFHVIISNYHMSLFVLTSYIHSILNLSLNGEGCEIFCKQ